MVKLRRRTLAELLVVDGIVDEILKGMPARVDRRTGAALISYHFFPISPRTLERWPIAWRRINGRALANVSDLLSEAKRRVDIAPAIRGGQ